MHTSPTAHTGQAKYVLRQGYPLGVAPGCDPIASARQVLRTPVFAKRALDRRQCAEFNPNCEEPAWTRVNLDSSVRTVQGPDELASSTNLLARRNGVRASGLSSPRLGDLLALTTGPRGHGFRLPSADRSRVLAFRQLGNGIRATGSRLGLAPVSVLEVERRSTPAERREAVRLAVELRAEHRSLLRRAEP